MLVNAEVDGIKCTVEKLPDGTIRVQHASGQFNPMQGPGTGGMVMYIVHPVQRNQYERLNALLPHTEQGFQTGAQPDHRPWWSLPAGERANLRE